MLLIYQNAKLLSNSRMNITIDEIRRINLRILIKESKSQAALAQKADTASSYFSQILSEKTKRKLGDELARKLEDVCGKPMGWMDQLHIEDIEHPFSEIESNVKEIGGFDLWDSNTPLQDDEVALPFFREVELAAGSGRNEVIENHGAKLRFAKSTLRRQGVIAEHAFCVTVSGNSMEPVLPDGSTVGIDTANTKVKNGDMYAIDHDGHLRVKMLYQMPGGALRIRSFNSDEWPDEHYSGDDLEKIRILGRVFWSSALW